MRRNTSDCGNMLFIILIATALFALLSFVLTKDWGGNSKTATEEEARLLASEIDGYGSALRPVIDRMLLLGGVADINTSGRGILFSAAGANAAYGAVDAQPTTELFNPAGGKAIYQTPPPAVCLSTCAYEFSGQYTVTGVGTDAKSELVMLVVDIPQKVCERANVISHTGWTSVPTGDVLTLTRFSGTNYGDNGGANPITLGGSFAGKRSFCYRESAGSQRYIFLKVLRAR